MANALTMDNALTMQNCPTSLLLDPYGMDAYNFMIYYVDSW